MPPVGPNDLWEKPAGRYWKHATTLFDYTRRAMPLGAPKSLSDDEVYALTALILHRNGVIGRRWRCRTAITSPTSGPCRAPRPGSLRRRIATSCLSCDEADDGGGVGR